MAPRGSDRIAPLGSVSRGFSSCLTAAPAASVTVGSQHAELNERGRSFFAALFDAEPDTMAPVEVLLTGRTPVDMVSPEEAAVILGFSRPTVVRWATAGHLTDHPVGPITATPAPRSSGCARRGLPLPRTMSRRRGALGPTVQQQQAPQPGRDRRN